MKKTLAGKVGNTGAQVVPALFGGKKTAGGKVVPVKERGK
jgi:hypothetical protein